MTSQMQRFIIYYILRMKLAFWVKPKRALLACNWFSYMAGIIRKAVTSEYNLKSSN